MSQRAFSDYNAPIDEETIRANKLAEFQAQIDATKSVYADKLNQARVQWQGRLWSGRALQARSWLLGSDFWQAQTQTIQGYNTEIENMIQAEENARLQAILWEARSGAAEEIAAKRAAKEAGGKAYLEFLQNQTAYKTDRTRKAAIALLQNNLTPDKITDEQLKQYNISRADLTMMYNEGKTQLDAQKAQAEAEKAKAELEARKTEAEIAYKEAQTIAEWLKNNELYEVGGKVYERGTNRYIADARSVQQSLSSGGWFSSSAPAWGFRTDRHNNPTAMTTDVARSLGLVEGVDYTRGDAFPDNPNLFTARLNGDPIQTTIKALDLAAQDPNKSAFRTQWGQPRWTYIDMTDEQWNAMTPEQKTATITTMYKNEGGTGALVGGWWGWQSGVEISMQPAFKNLRAKEQTQAVSLDNLVRELNKYREIIQNANIGKGGVELVWVNAGLIESQLNALLFAAAQAEGTGALQAADRQVLEKVIPNPTTLTGAFTSLKSWGLEGVYSKIDNQIRKYEENLKSLWLSTSYVRPNTPPPSTPTTGNTWTSPTGKTYNF